VGQNHAILIPDWPCPPQVKSVITTRHGGISRGHYASLNIADHVGDDPQAVIENRRRLRSMTGLTDEPAWLHQVHGTQVVNAAEVDAVHEADGSYAVGSARPCVVMTADCLPVLLTDTAGRRVAALHAGWRGLAAGIIERGLEKLDAADPLMAYLGPAIGPDAFEVGDDVVDAFCRRDSRAEQAFVPLPEDGKWLADLYLLARQQLAAAGVDRVYGGGRCTYSEPDWFYSYRRDRHCGRLASMIWIEPQR
jgi:YfiH family protein